MRNFCQAWTKSSLGSTPKISMVSSEASKISKKQLCEEYLKNGLFFHFKIPHNAVFDKFLKNSSQCWIHSGKNPAFLTPPPIFLNVGGGVFQNSSQCRIRNVLKNSSQCWIHPGKNPPLWGIFHAWTKSSLASLSKISKVSSEALKILKIQLCEEYLKNGHFFHFEIPHIAGFEKF